MKVLILSASVGCGHDKAAAAVSLALETGHRGNEVTAVTDFFGLGRGIAGRTLKKAYFNSLSYTPGIYRTLYRLAQRGRVAHGLRSMLANSFGDVLLDHVAKLAPDAIICTHPFPAMVLAALRKSPVLRRTLLTGVVTDFTVHKLWLQPELDLICVANEHSKQKLLTQGISPQSINPTGIPILPSFSDAGKREVSRPVNMRRRPFTVLIMGGGLGMVSSTAILEGLRSLKDQINIVVVAGQNVMLREQLRKDAENFALKNIEIWGYTNNVPDLMLNADLLITKPGGLTCSEALAAGLPMLLYGALPGQEEENAAYLAEEGAALWIKSKEELWTILSRILGEPDVYLPPMRRRAFSIAKPGAAFSIADAVAACVSRQGAAPLCGIFQVDNQLCQGRL